MLKMTNKIQHYDWGSKTALTDIYGIENADNQPMAELWMGAHPKCSSQVTDPQTGETIALNILIDKEPEKYLGEKVAQQFQRLPFLFKVLCAAQPLSIQVHPDKTSAEIGFTKENAQGIPLESAQRNYKDDNHKPELVYALTPFKAMNAFRPLSEIAQLLDYVSAAHPDIQTFLQQPTEQNLAFLFSQLLNMQGEQKQLAMAVLKSALNCHQGEPWDTIKNMASFYPDDNGLFAPLLLNVVELEPGQAMFLYARTPHAYLDGVALEVMANSDNVLRAGLTSKHIDVPELMANLDFIPKAADTLLTVPRQEKDALNYPVPVNDFCFSVYSVSEQLISLENGAASVLFCIEGQAVISTDKQQLKLLSGESIFLPAIEKAVTVYGRGRIARVSN
ncbi:mannose-6-phosphate isomerase [Xenorhabdus griffiniae]|uniref:mannose-6-phosphate isomerase n=1 Tax=Xenorhabdus griffiniae TaxID=351672 RepID=A0ABY9XN02_9GAMM|nr:mannose-6-phosphate isomerase [Xenorhabdus griffiniae]MBD1228287.1 mannose-6-phosphate isomerase [Xenorhabdus griffiniae]MBE8586260.1 mannose-6-phosphate isomerase [Xenorhabdus griffiniae]WMV74305.1 mannose-6-phosphate isomerase [Xenorhabdus griffiniae]WNH03985.1 mannose-6-phosphate isomerase [Xenorhabdus griffiniae]